MSLPEGSKNHTAVVTAVIVSLALIVCSLIMANAVNGFTSSKNSITVTGAAKKQIRSDLVVWRGNFSAQSPRMAEAYSRLNQDLAKVKAYLIQKGIPENDIVVSSINTMEVRKYSDKGMPSSEIDGYKLTQSVEITSGQVDKITEISRTSTELINQGVQFQSQPPQYFYTKLNDLKIDMLAEASKDAKRRAEQLVASSGGSIGALRSSKMGVFQITRPNSNEISDYGIYDTSSLEKEITAVVNAEFSVK